MIIKKTDDEQGYVYSSKEYETGHHILITSDYESLECDYMKNADDLMFYILVAMTNETELIVIEANKVQGSPYRTGYFIY